MSYAAAVLRVLAEEFPTEMGSPVTTQIISDAVARQADQGSEHFEVIIDDPILANWRLKADRQDPRRVRLACCRLRVSLADQEREKRINTVLAAI
ncbi:hypothetical protein ACGFNU_20955 [Spirillospora sp. NPDC048911]|uniref:hypothetical protein n=1 Tax=Spirillospora sp. NPDC048911 TaxID=3364527 RepID=UPI003716C329